MTAPAPLGTVRRRCYGVALLLVMALVAGLCLASYGGAFRRVDLITLQTTATGNQLAVAGDVTVRGLPVGEIRSITSDGRVATVELALDPAVVPRIPSNVTAMLVPKTLLGERTVALTVPPDPSPRPLADGDIIGVDRSRTAVETEKVFDHLMPVLSAVQPQKLSATLGTVAQALDGRGERLGRTLVGLNAYLDGVTPAMPDLMADLRAAPGVADAWTTATPDLAAALDDLAATSRTLVEQRAAFESTFRSVTRAADRGTAVLSTQGDDMVAVAATSRPVLDLAARYSSEFPCLFSQLTDLTPRVNAVMRPDTGVQIALDPVQGRGAYRPSDAPQFRDGRGPRCYRYAGRAPQDPPAGPILDGSSRPPGDASSVDPAADARARTGEPRYAAGYGTAPAGGPATVPQSAPGRVDAANIGLPDTPNSPEERGLVTELTGLQMGVAPSAVPAFAPYLTGATLRGAPVSVR